MCCGGIATVVRAACFLATNLVNQCSAQAGTTARMKYAATEPPIELALAQEEG